MATLRVDDDNLRIELTLIEKLSALRRTDPTFPWSQVRSIEAVAEPYRLVRGLRAPGLSIPGRTRIGTWRSAGRKTFAVTHKGRAGVRVQLRDSSFDHLLIDVEDPVASVGLLRDRLIPDVASVGPSEQVITFPSGPVTLSGTLLIPATPTASAVLISGSGDLDRDGDGRRARLGISRDISAALAAAGVVSLRYDKRGVGASGGDFLSSGFADNIDDARAAIAALRARPESVNIPVVAIGHSEGAMIATMVAAESTGHLDGVVLLSAPAGTGEQVLLWQAAKIAPTLPKPVKLIMRMLRTDPVRQQRKLLDRLKTTTTDVARIQGARINAKWFRELLTFDAKPQLERVTVPVLAITGTKDLQVDPADLDVIAALVPGPVTVDKIPDLTHILRRDSDLPTIGAYRRLSREPVDHVVLHAISEWIEKLAAAWDGHPSSAQG